MPMVSHLQQMYRYNCLIQINQRAIARAIIGVEVFQITMGRRQNSEDRPAPCGNHTTYFYLNVRSLNSTNVFFR